MKYDIVGLLSTILKEAGIKDVLEDGVSNHATISLNMKHDIPTIHIRNEDDEVWLWSKIAEQTPDSLAYCSARLIPLMLNHNESYFYTGQPCLYSVDGDLELRAQIKDKHLESADEFLSLLDHYLTILQEYRSVLL